MKSERYIRQSKISEWDQDKLSGAVVAVAGLGGQGSASATYLAAAGVGKLVLVDNGKVELSNLNRQTLYTEVSVGALKADVAKARLSVVNSEIEIESHAEKIDTETVHNLFKSADIIIDGLDNNATRAVINEFCVEANTPFIFGAVEGWDGLVSTVGTKGAPCLSCILDERSFDKRKEAPLVPGFAAGLIGCCQVSEAIKLITGAGDNLTGRLQVLDLFKNTFDSVRVEVNPACPICHKS